MDMALSKNFPNLLHCIAFLEERMFGWCAFHDKECLDCGVVDSPMVMSVWFELGVGNRKQAIKV